MFCGVYWYFELAGGVGTRARVEGEPCVNAGCADATARVSGRKSSSYVAAWKEKLGGRNSRRFSGLAFPPFHAGGIQNGELWNGTMFCAGRAPGDDGLPVPETRVAQILVPCMHT